MNVAAQRSWQSVQIVFSWHPVVGNFQGFHIWLTHTTDRSSHPGRIKEQQTAISERFRLEECTPGRLARGFGCKGPNARSNGFIFPFSATRKKDQPCSRREQRCASDRTVGIIVATPSYRRLKRGPQTASKRTPSHISRRYAFPSRVKLPQILAMSDSFVIKHRRALLCALRFPKPLRSVTRKAP